MAEMMSQAVPVYHPGLSLQPNFNRRGHVNPGKLLLRCSSWLRRSSGDNCWFSHPFPMALFDRLPRNVQDEYLSVRQAMRRGAIHGWQDLHSNCAVEGKKNDQGPLRWWIILLFFWKSLPSSSSFITRERQAKLTRSCLEIHVLHVNTLFHDELHREFFERFMIHLLLTRASIPRHGQHNCNSKSSIAM